MKKIKRAASIITAALVCSTSAAIGTVNAESTQPFAIEMSDEETNGNMLVENSSGDNVVSDKEVSGYFPDTSRNYDYFNSLSDEEVFSQYKAYREAIGNSISETTVSNGIIEYDFLSELSYMVTYGNVDTTFFEITFPKLIGEKIDILSTKTPDYFGISEDSPINYDVRPVFENESRYKAGNLSFSMRSFTLDDEDGYDILRKELTIYNSQFYIDYGEERRIIWGYIDKADTSLAGDVNLDGKVRIDDVVQLLSHIADRDAYPLYIKGAQLGDVYQKGDGISASDAAAIQKYLTLIIPALPES